MCNVYSKQPIPPKFTKLLMFNPYLSARKACPSNSATTRSHLNFVGLERLDYKPTPRITLREQEQSRDMESFKSKKKRGARPQQNRFILSNLSIRNPRTWFGP